MMKKTFLIFVALFIQFLYVSAQEQDTSNTVINKFENWYNKSPLDDSIYGTDVEKAYNELLKDKESFPVIVAVIDAGVDITHEDLKSQIWVNPKEIADNGIDDDENGYVDDIHGWDFLGNSKGEIISYENVEPTRIVKQYESKFANKKSKQISEEDKEAYALYKNAKELFESDLKNAQRQKKGFQKFENKYYTTYNNISLALNGTEITTHKLDSLKQNNKKYKKDIKFLYPFIQFKVDSSFFGEITAHINEELDYHLNLNFNPRDLIGDDQNNINEYYGNNNVYGPEADHGTAVSGIIAASRNNDLGVNGITNNAQIMVLKVVPNGDERDKDIAKAVRYAADNGARIINMSFGKRLSPQKNMVDEAFLYAEEKGVLIVHASGNDGFNIDKVKQYPTRKISEEKQISTWISVGASSMNLDKKFAANFTNYGVNMVDIFAPGVNMKTLAVESKYDSGSGTSYAAPVVSGVAALILSYFPDLTASQLKDIILKSAVRYPDLMVNKPGDNSRKPKKVKFETLSGTAGLVNAYNAIKLAEDIK